MGPLIAVEPQRRSPSWAERFRSAFDEAPVGMALVAPTGQILRANQALRSMLGHERDALTGMMIHDLTHPEDLESDLISAWLLLAGELGSYQVEKRLVHRDGRTLWALLSVSMIRDAQGQRSCFVAHVQDVTHRHELEQRLRHRALHDPLTGLPNRALFCDRLARALEGAGHRGEPVTVLLLDLDGFKRVNDGFGHDAGDRLLMAVGQRLAACLRTGDIAARFGGDEFALLVERSRTTADAIAVADRVLAALQSPLSLGTQEVAISASIGIARSDGQQVRASDLLREADVALYQAKDAGRATFFVYERELNADEEHPSTSRPIEIDLPRVTTWLTSGPAHGVCG